MAKVLRAADMSKCLGCFSCMFVCAGYNRQSHSLKKSCIRIRTGGGLAGRFVAIVCQACINAGCAEVCPSGALSPRNGGGVRLDTKKCIGCRRCESACMVRSIAFDEEEHKPIVCHHCGICARFCPHECLKLVEGK